MLLLKYLKPKLKNSVKNKSYIYNEINPSTYKAEREI